MEKIKLYSEFIYGTIQYESEQEFTQLFASDEEFRSGFKSYLSIISVINQNINKFSPDRKITNRIFADLGLKIPTVVNGIPFFRQPILKSRLFTGIISGLTTAILTAFLVLLFSNHGEITGKNQSSEPLTKKIHRNSGKLFIKKSLEEQEVKLLKNKNIMSNFTNFANNQNKVHDLLNNNKLLDEKQANINYSQFEFASIGKNTEYFKDTLWQNPKNQNILPVDFLIEQSISNILSLEVKHSLNWNLPKENIYPNEISKMNNMSLALLYELVDNIFMGIDIRQETFFVEYTGFESNDEFKYEQQPNLLSCNILLRYKYDGFGMLKPTLQTSAGFNSAGSIVRQSAGFEYNLYPQLTLFINGEYSYFVFNHLSQFFNASKISINYGIGFKL